MRRVCNPKRRRQKLIGAVAAANSTAAGHCQDGPQQQSNRRRRRRRNGSLRRPRRDNLVAAIAVGVILCMGPNRVYFLRRRCLLVVSPKPIGCGGETFFFSIFFYEQERDIIIIPTAYRIRAYA